MRRVFSYPRLHTCLFDLGEATPRKFGGAGFSILGLPAIVEARSSRRMTVDFSTAVDRSTRTSVLSAIGRLSHKKAGVAAQVHVLDAPPQHVGLGSKTAILLGTIKAIDLACDLRLANSEIQAFSGRGGASGIGINTFFSGGFLIDNGHDARVCRGFLPSRFRIPTDVPPPTYRSDIPDRWCFHLLLTPGKLTCGADEREFFKRNTPISKHDVFKTIALAYHGLVPAVRGEDLELLREVLRSIHKIGFKHCELRGQPTAVRNIVRVLGKRDDCAVGLSSMGPLVYAVSDSDNQEFGRFLASLCSSTGARMLGAFRGRNLGYESQ